MPPPYVRTIRDEIHYEYAKLISRSALGEINYKFISDRFKKLQAGEITPSGTLREWEREQSLPKVCVYCRAASGLTTDHLVPRNRGGKTRRRTRCWPAPPATRRRATGESSNGWA